MNATLNLRLFSGKRSLITTDQSKFRLRCSAETTVVHRSSPKMRRFESLIGEPPANGLPALHPPYTDIEAQSDQPNEQHARQHQVVAGMLLIGLIGLGLDIGIRRMERWKSVRWGFANE